MGDSVGRWDGDHLVVDTDQLHGEDPLQRVGRAGCTWSSASPASTPRPILYRFTVEDPTTWERSWTGEYPWRATDEKLYEYACHEGNYSLGGMLRGARQKEADDAAGKKSEKTVEQSQSAVSVVGAKNFR